MLGGGACPKSWPDDDRRASLAEKNLVDIGGCGRRLAEKARRRCEAKALAGALGEVALQPPASLPSASAKCLRAKPVKRYEHLIGLGYLAGARRDALRMCAALAWERMLHGRTVPGRPCPVFDESLVEEVAAVNGFAVESVERCAKSWRRHRDASRKSGARLLFLHNADENKAFFHLVQNPPVDDTGVFHILEHSVLCGSDKFPVERAVRQSAENLDADVPQRAHVPDKTMYPVASTNDQDLENLTDVYMDAVLPGDLPQARGVRTGRLALQARRRERRGRNARAPALQRRGVQRGMKGALSESVLYRGMNTELFLACYAFESGGHPRHSSAHLRGCLDTHTRHYRLDRFPISCSTATSTPSVCCDSSTAATFRPTIARRARPLSPTDGRCKA